MTTRKPTQADVARLAAVSQTTVSYVVNDAPVAVPLTTRRRVLDAITTLGYVPNSAARGLRTGKTTTIAAIFPDISNPFYPAMQRGLQDVAERHNHDLIAYNTDGDAAKERQCLRSVREGRVDGVVVVPFHLTPDDLLPLVDRGIPVVALAEMVDLIGPTRFDRLSVDNAAAARAAVSYLIDLGHRRIGMVAGQNGTPPRERRIRGYQQALAEHALPIDEVLIRGTDFSEAGGYEAAQDLIRVEPRPSAIFAANDLMAFGAMIALREAGLRVPEDVAVIGFDDIPAARLIHPALTTIAQFPERLGRRAATMLFERLTGEWTGAGRVEGQPWELIVRSSA